ncbi:MULTISPECIES: diacylglycerol/lipid kinase family protein [Sutcliffiella]|uniref:Lipid kinase n=1 Tax=Sutcliffiella cohnii TaxID=33932 RepID=A0A223KV19_9BACI|nr:MULTISPECIES: diacylglycerol kinase family protein [Sutcliffiella]AST93204.1 lipid kinase [Sutcliffiella cohnii]MED4016615.1 diacylglycerol kinase family lipid kinase [Sutcliffiella cohnii]WBL14407.1 diacylglycerol kinase family lipid kinase [Sutcliffiella sp. NC1]
MYYFIVNKVSGSGRAYRIWNQIEKRLNKECIPYSVFFTERQKHATELVKEITKKDNVSAIVAIGGDGTVHEVINGIIGTTTPLGIIPAGSGNDFSRGLGIPLDYNLALNRLLNGEPKIIDIGNVNSTYFGTVAGIGFDGKVADTTNRSKHKKLFSSVRLGKISYIISALNVLLRYKPQDITLKIDNELHHLPGVWLVAVANLPFYGGGLVICPKAVSNDGLFEICIAQNMTKLQFLRLLPTVFKGNHTHSPSITILKGKELEIICSDPLLIHGDGEIIGQTPTKIRIEHSALHVMS